MAVPEPAARYAVRPSVPSPPRRPSPTLNVGGGAGAGPVVDGYGLEVVGQPHRNVDEGATSVVHLPPNTRYTLRLSNANSHLVMVRVDIDEVHVGTLLLNPYTYCDLERPLDRPLAFTFCYTQDAVHTPDEAKTNAKNSMSSRAASVRRSPSPSPPPTSGTRTSIRCIFQPQQGAKTIELDVRAHHLDKVKRYEIAQDTNIAEFFRDLSRDFGPVAEEPGCALIHWTNAEYDSPVEEVLIPDELTLLGSSIRKDDPLRKMSLVVGRKLEIRDDLGTEMVVDLSWVPRFDDVIQNLQRAVGGRHPDDTRPLYFQTRAGRVLGSTTWISVNGKPEIPDAIVGEDEVGQ